LTTTWGGLVRQPEVSVLFLRPACLEIGAFVQDDIKVSPDLTVNIGLRYDYQSFPDNSLRSRIDTSNPFLPIDTKLKIAGDYNNLAHASASPMAAWR